MSRDGRYLFRAVERNDAAAALEELEKGASADYIHVDKDPVGTTRIPALFAACKKQNLTFPDSRQAFTLSSVPGRPRRMKLAPKGRSVNSWVSLMSLRTSSASLRRKASIPNPPAFETAAAMAGLVA